MSCLLVLIGCSKEEFKPIYNVPPEFQPIVERFMQEGEQRGFSFKIHNLIIKYDEGLDKTICGQYNSNSKNAPVQKIISINSNIQCWTNAEEQEALIFHELGHCFLDRLHESALLPNGDPKSIVVEGNVNLYSRCVYDIGNGQCDKTFKRTYYIDELFDERTAIPDWGK